MASKDPPRISVLIPTYNNARTVGAVIEEALQHCDDVLVVDDGSSDATARALDSLGDRIRLLRHERNRGKGVALRDGFELLRESGFSHAISLDADGQHYPGDLPGFMEKIREQPGALHVGQRDMKQVGAPRRSLFGLWFSNTALRRLGGVSLKDSQAGFRAYPLAEISGLKLRGTRYDLELEVLIKAAWKGIPLLPVPIRCSYEPEGGRVSHFRPVRDFCQIGFQVLKLVASK